jgi:hypothetical protein
MGYSTHEQRNLFKSVRYSIAVDRVAGSGANVEYKAERPIRCDNTNVPDTGAFVTILSKKVVVGFRNEHGNSIFLQEQLASVHIAWGLRHRWEGRVLIGRV